MIFFDETRPDTRPSVADGWAGAEMRAFPLFNSSVTDKASYWKKVELRNSTFSFLVADTQLYKRLCPSVGPSVRHARVEKWENAHFRPCPTVRNWWPCIRPGFQFPYSFVRTHFFCLFSIAFAVCSSVCWLPWSVILSFPTSECLSPVQWASVFPPNYLSPQFRD